MSNKKFALLVGIFFITISSCFNGSVLFATEVTKVNDLDYLFFLSHEIIQPKDVFFESTHLPRVIVNNNADSNGHLSSCLKQVLLKKNNAKYVNNVISPCELLDTHGSVLTVFLGQAVDFKKSFPFA